MTRLILSVVVATGVIALASCSPSEPISPDANTPPATAITPTDAVDIPEAVRSVVLAARPGMVIAEAELKEREGRRYYDVEGTLSGAEIELDLLETPRGWEVVEIQRDLPWAEIPGGVRTAAEGARAGFVRRWGVSHIVHHRAQLGVYLRLLDVPVPGLYGPSADD